MGSPQTLLEQSENQAAMSRFFCNSELERAGEPEYDPDNPWVFSNYFHKRYEDLLLSGKSTITELAIGQDGRQAPYEKATFVPQAVLQLGFDISRWKQGIYGWQISLTEKPKDLLSEQAKRTVSALYTMAHACVAGYRQYDMQGRSSSSLGLSSGEGLVGSAELQGSIKGLVDFEEIDMRAEAMRKGRGTAAQDILKYLEEHRDTAQTDARVRDMKIALARIAFAPTHFKIKFEPKNIPELAL